MKGNKMKEHMLYVIGSLLLMLLFMYYAIPQFQL